MKAELVSILMVSMFLLSPANARDYSYMDDRPSDSRSSTTKQDKSMWKSVVDATVAATMDSVFTREEKDIIRRYYRGDEHRDRERYYSSRDYDGHDTDKKHKKHKKKKSLPPGLRKKMARGGELPPGWQKKVQRGEVMDADLYYRSRPLPEDLRRRLPRLEYGAEVRQLEGKIVKVMDATGAIIDVFDF